MSEPTAPSAVRNGVYAPPASPSPLPVLDSRLSYGLARCLLALVFLYAGGVKLPDPYAFSQVIGGYGLLPPALLMPTAVGLPLLEVLAAMALLVDVRGSLGLLTGLTLLFMAVLAYGIHLGLDIDCGCYGPEDPEAEAYHGLEQALLRDAGLLAVCAYCYWWRWRHKPALPTVRSFMQRKTQGGV